MPSQVDGASSRTGKASVFERSWSWLQVVVAGLLGSSCCLLQLVVNVLTTMNVIHGIGCTGFNKTLGPVRLHLRAITLIWMAISWYLALKRGLRNNQLVLQTVIFFVLTFLPEILLVSGGPALAPPTDNVEVLKLKVDGMGCEACQTHVKSVIDQWGGVVESEVNFETGTAEVRIAKDWAKGQPGTFDMAAVAKKLEVDGYFMEPHEEL